MHHSKNNSTQPISSYNENTDTSNFNRQLLECQHKYNGAIIPPASKKFINKKCLVLDLDETLVHSSFKPVESPDVIIPVDIDGRVCNV